MPPGRVSLRVESAGVVSLTGLRHLPSDQAAAVEVVTELVEHAFATGHHRVEAQIPVGDAPTRRALQRAGLRPEGTARGAALDVGGVPEDQLRLARLRADPPLGTSEAFLGMLNATLPSKRVIVQGLARDGQGRVLLCELTYKRDWDLPGGVAEPAESPVVSLQRELREELGTELPVGELVAVDWLPPYKQWQDAVLLVFDLGDHPGLQDRAVLQPTELAAVHWRTVEEAAGHVAPYVHRLLASVEEHLRSGDGGTAFLEDGLPRT